MSKPVQLLDPASGRVEELPARSLRVHLASGGMRAAVVADLVRRLVTRRRQLVLLTYAEPVDWNGWRPADLNVAEGSPGDGSDADLCVCADAADVPGGRALVVPPDAGPQGLEWIDEASLDRLCVRLAVLNGGYRAAGSLDPGLVNDALEELYRWRRLVAEWAEGPGRPIDRAYAAEAEDALADDLDSPRALAVLRRLAEDPAVDSGAKLETVIHLDLLLGLDLVRDIGRR